jgi:hypothetical protein
MGRRRVTGGTRQASFLSYFVKRKMRPGQQNNNNSNNNKNRQRGRSNNSNNNNNGGRKHLNPLSRNYESNGPDVKVRGNAAHIAEKYVQLARDAHGSGDSVMAENYLQHAEHYYRIVLAAQPQPIRTDQPGQESTEVEDDDDYAGDEQSRFDTPQFRASLQAERPYQDQQRNDQQNGQYSQNGQQSGQNSQNNQQGERPPHNQNNQPQGERPPRYEQPRVEQPQPPRDETVVIVASEAPEATTTSGDVLPVEAQAGEEPRRRERRPRRRRPAGGEGNVDPNGPQPEVGELPAFITAGGATNPAE